MGDINNEISENHVLNVEDGKLPVETKQDSNSFLSIIAEVLGTYFLIFAHCAAVVVNFDSENKNKTLFSLAISIVWGLIVTMMSCSVGHISGGHFNPAVTIAFATIKRFPWKHVVPYIVAQVLGSTLANGTLKIIFTQNQDHFVGTSPSGSVLQVFVIAFIIRLYLIFVVFGVATDSGEIGGRAGLAVGSTVLLNVMSAGPITGAPMNPARSLGPAIVSNHYKHLWIYIMSPILGAVCGALVDVIRFRDKPLRELTKSGSLLRGAERTSD